MIFLILHTIIGQRIFRIKLGFSLQSLVIAPVTPTKIEIPQFKMRYCTEQVCYRLVYVFPKQFLFQDNICLKIFNFQDDAICAKIEIKIKYNPKSLPFAICNTHRQVQQKLASECIKKLDSLLSIRVGKITLYKRNLFEFICHKHSTNRRLVD